MATATKNKAPVAGQPGYKPEEPVYPHLEDLQKEGEERALLPVAAKPQRTPTPEPSTPAKDAKGSDLLEYLVSSGTNPVKMAHVREWLSANPGATAVATFRYLESAEENGQPTSQGTLRKAGKWVWGSAWELESAVLQAPAEEIKNLREKVATLEGQLGSKNNEVASLRSQIAFLQEANGKLGSQVDFLKSGKSPEELRSIGIG